jgi:hypothetical protein
MNPRIMPANSPPPIAGFPGHFQDLCSFAMDQAIGIEKVSLTTFVSLNSSLIDIYKSAFCCSPVFSDLVDTAAKSLALSMEMQMNWLSMMLPPATGSLRVASSVDDPPARPVEDELADSMDVAIGADVASPVSTVSSISDNRSRRPEEKREKDMDVAIGRAA